jgi:hypothetical protein
MLKLSVGQSRIYAPCMTVYSVITLPKIPYTHRIYMVLANPTQALHLFAFWCALGCLICKTSLTPSAPLLVPLLHMQQNKHTHTHTKSCIQHATYVTHTNPCVCCDIYHRERRLHHLLRVGQNCIYTPYMTLYIVISLLKVPYIHRIYRVLANPTPAAIAQQYYLLGSPHSKMSYVSFAP